MSTEHSSSTSRIARLLSPRRVLPVALLFLIADLALTETLLGLAVEKNPIAAWLFESIGVGVTGVVAVGVVTLAYVGLDALDQYGREQRVVSGGLLGVMIAPVVWNFGIWVRLGTPDVAVGIVGETLAPVILAALGALAVVTVDMGRVPRPDRDVVVSIALSVLMVTSMVGGVAFVGTQPIESNDQGSVSAQPDGLNFTNFETESIGDTQINVVSDSKIDYTIDKETPSHARTQWGGDSGNVDFGMEIDNQNGFGRVHTGFSYKTIENSDNLDTDYFDTRSSTIIWDNNGDVLLSNYNDTTSKLHTYETNTQYYYSLSIGGGTMSAEVYESSNKSNLINQTSVSANASEDLTYFYALAGSATFGGGNGETISGIISNPSISKASSSPFPGWEDTAPLLRAVDQNGDPVPNAEIEAWSVQSENLGDEVENKEARAEEILDELDDVQPDQWTPPTQADLSYGDLTDLYGGEQPSGLYPTAHTKGDMGIAGWADTHDLIPRLEFESGETIYLYAWDGSAGANMGPTDDGVTSEHYGEIADEPTFNLKRLSATGETLDNHTVSATETYSGGIPPLSYDHNYATAEVPDGYYLVTVQGSDTPGYVIKVGEATDVLTTEMRTEANQLTKQAESLQNYLEGDTMARDSVIANEKLTRQRHEEEAMPLDYDAFDYGDGYVNVGLSESGKDINDLERDRVDEFPSVSGTEIYLQGYRGPGYGVGDYGTNDTSDIMELASNVDEPIYVSKKPKRVDLSKIEDPNNATIEVTLTKLDTGLNPNISEYANKTERLKNELLNQSTAELESLFRDNPELLNKTDLETRHEELQDLIESNNDLEERVEELRDAESVEDAGNATEEQLRNDLAAMEQAIAELEGQLEAEPPTSEIDNGEIFAEFPFAESLDPDSVTVIANYEDGSSEVVPEEYISVESASVLGGDQVVVEGLEIASDRAVADLEVKGVSTEGALGSSRDTITNPAYQGTIPELDAIDVSTLRPGVGESVAVEPRSSAEGYDGAESVTVYDPTGQTLNVTQNGERFTWSPNKAGTHTVRLTYTNDIGGQFTETFRLAAEENPSSTPPTVRVTDGIGGNLLLAGNGLESGSISVNGADAEIVAQAPSDQSPSSLDIRAQQLTVDSMDISVVIGGNQQSVDRHVSLRVWANFGVENALVLRGPSEPITANEETPFGAFETRTSESGAEHQVVETYTDADGTTTVQVKRNPSLLDRASYQIAIWGIDLPLTILPTTPQTALPLTMTAPPAVDEATAGQVVFGPSDMATAVTEVTA